MENLKIKIDNVLNFVSIEDIMSLQDDVDKCCDLLKNKTGKGNDYLGWLDLPSKITAEEIEEIVEAADNLRKNSQIIVVTGIGGSYLGARAVIDALSNNFSATVNGKKSSKPLIVYAGQNISGDYITELLKLLDKKDYSIIVISKSGTTTEPAVAFRLLKNHIENKYGKKKARKRIVAITDKEKGALKKLSDNEDYKTFVIPDDVGGRFSVLTPVGLLPIAAAGFDIKKLVSGAKYAEEFLNSDTSFANNPANLYAATRNLLYRKGKVIEILANYTPALAQLTEWWKQLYGESEGKTGKGIFPAGVNFTTDLHSMGQLIQDGMRILFETVLWVDKPRRDIPIPTDKNDLDGLNYIAGKTMSEVNHNAMLGTMMAHVEGGVPNITISIPEVTEYNLGSLLYFFEKACGVSGYLLGVNPFDQPGVEAYKKNMFRLLGKV